MNNVRELRFLVKRNNILRKICKLAFSDADASIYLFPYAARGKYYYGNKNSPDQESEYKFDFTEDIFQEKTPKLSIHERGQIHIHVNDKRAGPLFIPHLSALKGQHIASISPDSFDSLPIHSEKIRETGTEIDHVIHATDNVKNGRLAIYVNGFEPKFDTIRCEIIITLQRPSLSKPLYVGILPVEQQILGTPAPKGVTVIAGWDPTKSQKNGFDFLYIRGE